MSALSLNASIRTCTVDSGQANRIESDRFLNPNNMVCIPWNGYNNKGQRVCPDSFWTKTPGCNSATDRVVVENNLRPDYATYINLNANGISGDIYGSVNSSAWDKSGGANKWEQSRNDITGQFGNQFRSTNINNCSLQAYEKGMSQNSEANRKAQAAQQGYWSQSARGLSGTC